MIGFTAKDVLCTNQSARKKGTMKYIESRISTNETSCARLCSAGFPTLKIRPVLLFFVIILSISGSALTSSACTTPVWRYALEQWWPDPFYIDVQRPDELTTNQQQAVDLLESSNEQKNTFANIVVDVVIDSSVNTPVLTVEYPGKPGMEMDKPFWKTELTFESATNVLSSPFRKRLATELGSGENVVWFVLESSNAETNEAVMNLLEAQVGKAEKEYEEYRQYANRIATSEYDKAYTLPKMNNLFLSLDRGNKEEEFFIKSLLHLYPDLKSSQEPMVFVVYGKGRCLPPIVGDEITVANIDYYFQFLSGPCSCMIKDNNPGFDLLMEYDWEEAAFMDDAYVDDTPPELTGVMGSETGDFEGVAEKDAEDTLEEEQEAEAQVSAEDEPAFSPAIAAMLIGFAAVLAIALFGSLMLARKGKHGA